MGLGQVLQRHEKGRVLLFAPPLDQGQQVLGSRGLAGPVNTDDQHASQPWRIHDLLHESQRRGAGPLQVVKDQDQGYRRRRNGAQQVQHGLLEPDFGQARIDVGHVGLGTQQQRKFGQQLRDQRGAAACRFEDPRTQDV